MIWKRNEIVEEDFWTLPTALGYISIGLACVVASPLSFSPLEMALMSVLVHMAQFAMISLIAPFGIE